MKKSLIAILVLGLIAGALSAPAMAKKKKKKPSGPVRVERTEEYEYTSASPGASPAQGLAVGACMTVIAPDSGSACVNFAIATTESYAKVEATDTGGQKVYLTMSQDVDGDGISDIFGQFCGTSGSAVPITPGLDLRVSVMAVGEPGCPGPATTGTIKVTISNLP